MKRILLTIATLTLFLTPLAASEWTGSLQFTNGGAAQPFTGSLKGGKGVVNTASGRIHVTRDGNKITLRGNNVTGKGTIQNGKVTGTFNVSGVKGTFSGRRGK